MKCQLKLHVRHLVPTEYSGRSVDWGREGGGPVWCRPEYSKATRSKRWSRLTRSPPSSRQALLVHVTQILCLQLSFRFSFAWFLQAVCLCLPLDSTALRNSGECKLVRIFNREKINSCRSKPCFRKVSLGVQFNCGATVLQIVAYNTVCRVQLLHALWCLQTVNQCPTPSFKMRKLPHTFSIQSDFLCWSNSDTQTPISNVQFQIQCPIPTFLHGNYHTHAHSQFYDSWFRYLTQVTLTGHALTVEQTFV